MSVLIGLSRHAITRLAQGSYPIRILVAPTPRIHLEGQTWHGDSRPTMDGWDGWMSGLGGHRDPLGERRAAQYVLDFLDDMPALSACLSSDRVKLPCWRATVTIMFPLPRDQARAGGSTDIGTSIA